MRASSSARLQLDRLLVGTAGQVVDHLLDQLAILVHGHGFAAIFEHSVGRVKKLEVRGQGSR